MCCFSSQVQSLNKMWTTSIFFTSVKSSNLQCKTKLRRYKRQYLKKTADSLKLACNTLPDSFYVSQIHAGQFWFFFYSLLSKTDSQTGFVKILAQWLKFILLMMFLMLFMMLLLLMICSSYCWCCWFEEHKTLVCAICNVFICICFFLTPASQSSPLTPQTLSKQQQKQ